MGREIKKMNAVNTGANKYYKKTESFIKIAILYIQIVCNGIMGKMKNLYKNIHNLKEYALFLIGKVKSFIMYIFLEDLIQVFSFIWNNTDFYKPRPVSSKLGIAYVFLILMALNLAGFNIFLTQRSSHKQIAQTPDFLSTVKVEKVIVEESDSLVPELEIFQQIIRHSDMDQHLALKLASIINAESQKYNIDPYLILSVIQVESRFSPKAVSHKGARGLMQLMPTTGRYVANKYDLPMKNTRSLFDPVTNIRLGVAYLSYLENMYGNMDYALFAYNHGPKKSKHIKKTFSKSKPYYVKAVMNFKEFLDNERLITES